MLFLFFFFFSSRRRHTRLQGDWSSDVCSSDLIESSRLVAEPLVEWHARVWYIRRSAHAAIVMGQSPSRQSPRVNVTGLPGIIRPELSLRCPSRCCVGPGTPAGGARPAARGRAVGWPMTLC